MPLSAGLRLRVWRLGLVVLLAACLAACAASPQRIEQAGEILRLEQGRIQLETTAPSSEPPDLDALLWPGQGHHLLIIGRGDEALAVRLAMIRAARERIRIQNYIFYADTAGALLLEELVHAARRGVQVQLLVDSLFSLPDASVQALLALADPNLELRLYNPIFERAVLGNAGFLGAIACCFRSLNHRMHNKLVTVDGRHGLIGGRNTADRYFDLDTRMNFIDLEVLVSGPVVAAMEAGFERYWQHRRSRRTWHTRDVIAALRDDPPRVLDRLDIERTGFALAMLDDEQWLPGLIQRRGHRVGPVEYFSDPPDKPWDKGSEDSTRLLHDLILSAQQSVLIQTPYFVMSPRFERLLAERDPDVVVTVSSNSLAATDAYPVHAISRRQRARMVGALDIRYYEAKPFPANRHHLIPRYSELIAERAAGFVSPMRGDPAPATRDMPGPRISVHAKLLVVDQRLSVVTSHNFDPRSEIYNTENGIIVDDEDFARALTEFISPMTEPPNAWLVAMRSDGEAGMGGLGRRMAHASRRLPTFDLWPHYLTQNYQLPSSIPAPDRDDPRFHEHWVAVGQAPEVERGQRRIMTSLISRMFGFLWPIM